MKNSTLPLVAVLALAATGASAQTMYGDVARVLSSTPIKEQVAFPGRECRREPITTIEERRIARPGPEEGRTRSDGPGAGAILGAIIGGVIGHQFGNSTGGRDHGTAAGAVIGGLIGHGIERDAEAGYEPAGRDVTIERAPVTREIERCNETAEARDRIVGYDVRYEYNGREFRTRLPYEPGPEIPVNVEVRPPSPRTGPAFPTYRGPY